MSSNQISTQQNNVPALRPTRIPYHPAFEKTFGVSKVAWKALVEAVFPLAQSIDSVAMALSYCKARNLDPMKRVVHIVPIYDKDKGCYVDTVWPGIGELRTTAHRTGSYAGIDEAVLGPMTRQLFEGKYPAEVEFPLWAQITVYRIVKGVRVPFAGPKVYWLETYAQSGRDPVPNAMWKKRPIGQLVKCAEAAALRAAFPEECGNDYIAEEAFIEGSQSIQATRIIEPPEQKRLKSDVLADKLSGAAETAQQEPIGDDESFDYEGGESAEYHEESDVQPSGPGEEQAAEPEYEEEPSAVEKDILEALAAAQNMKQLTDVKQLLLASKKKLDADVYGRLGKHIDGAISDMRVAMGQSKK